MKEVNSSDLRINHDHPPIEDKTQTPLTESGSSSARNRIIGLTLLVALFAAFWVYGWAGEIALVQITTQPNNVTSQVIYGKLLILSGVFTVIGFGLLLAYFKQMGAVALLLSLFVVSFTIITSPLVSKFWFNVFLSDFIGKTFTTDNPDRFFLQSFGGLTIFLDLYNLKVAFANCISQLVMLLGVFGRVSMAQVVFNTILYNITWNLCHFLCALLQTNGPDTRIFDDYQISNVYLFAACYSLAVALLLPSHSRKTLPHSSSSIILALTGTFFVFMSFCVTSTLFPLKFTPGQVEYARSYIWQEGFISVFFALSASVIFSCAGSALFGGRIDVRDCVFGTITGGIIYGAVAGTSVNVGAAIASGLFAGLFSSLSYRFIYKRINASTLYDSYGVINILMVSFFGTFAIAPVILIAYYNLYWVLTTLEVSNFDKVGLPLINSSVAGWVLIYVGISMGIGIVAGLIAGLFLRLIGSSVKAHNHEFFTLDYGLTPRNAEAFYEELPITTRFDKALRVLTNQKVEKRAILSLIEVTEGKREGGKLVSSRRETIDVQLSSGVTETELEAVAADLKRHKLTANVYRGEGEIRPRDYAPPEDDQKFKTFYYLFKSKKIEEGLIGTSLTDYVVETSERSVAGVVERRVAIKASFDRRDNGVEYLNFLKGEYDGLSLQTNIKS
jgi:hypothetical protein